MSRSLTTSSIVALALAAVACNEPPGGGVVSITPEAPLTTDPLVLSIDEEAVDPNGHSIDYEIAWSRNGIPVAELEGQTEVPADQTARGQVWEVQVVPVDEKGEPGPSLSASVTVLNAVPTATVSIAPEAPRTGEALTATAQTEDVDGDQVEVTWRWLRDGTPTEYVTETVPEGVTARGQTWEVEVVPNDGSDEGEAVRAEVSIDNALPVATSVTLSPERPTRAGPIVATPVGYDDDGDEIEWRYTWSVNDVALPDVEGPELSPDAFAKGATVSVTAIPFDGFAEGAAVTSEDVAVVNAPPSAEGAAISPEVVRGDTNASCSLIGWSDLDGDPEGFSTVWEVNGREVGTGATLLASEFEKDDVLTCIVIPDDGTDEGEPVRSPSVTVANTPPVLASVSLSPSSPREADTVSATLTGAEDIDGDRITFRYRWLVDGTAISATSAELTGADFDKGQTIAVEVTPNDGSVDGTPVTSAAVTAANTPPVVSSVTLSPTTAYTSTPVSASVSATDADGDSLTSSYTWYLQDEGSGGFTRLTTTGATLPASAFDKDDIVYVSVTATDGDDTSAAVESGRLTIANTLPATPGSVALSPSSPSASANLTCTTAPVTDPDGDGISYRYQWYKNGSLDSSTTTTARTATLSASRTAGGERWDCRVAACDGDGCSSPRTSSSVTITSSVRTWSFTDTSGNDVTGAGLMSFFTGLGTVSTSDYIFFEVDGGSTTAYDGAWCSQRADWYVSNYRSRAASGSSVTSGTWTKWHRGIGGSWSSSTAARSEIFGRNCDSVPYSWCSNWGGGGRYLAVMPDQSRSGESYASGWSSGRSWRVTIRVGGTRRDACGF